MKVKQNVSYQISCDCGKSIEIVKIEEAKGWEIEPNLKSVIKVLCPDCSEKEKNKIYHLNAFEIRLNAGYYRDFPNKFEDDAFEELGITGNSKANLLYSKAYEMGHSAGYTEIYNYMRDLVDLIE